jgi:hypothetical protein
MGIRSENIYEQPLKYEAYSDLSFVTGDSPATHDVNAGLGRNGIDGFIDNYGAGALYYALSSDGTTYGDNILLPAGAIDSLKGYSGGGIGEGIDSIKITWIANTSYSIRVR